MTDSMLIGEATGIEGFSVEDVHLGDTPGDIVFGHEVDRRLQRR